MKANVIMVIKISIAYRIRLYTCHQTIPLCIYRDHHNLMHFFNSNGHITVNNYQNTRLYQKPPIHIKQALKHFRFPVHTVTVSVHRNIFFQIILQQSMQMGLFLQQYP